MEQLRRCHKPAVTACWFLLILALGLGARLANIARESVWWDEFATVVHLQPPQEYRESPYYERWNQAVIRQTAPNLRAFLRQNRLLDPAALPLYLTLEFYWNRFVSVSVFSLRLMSLLLGMLILPVMFLLGRRIFGTGPGLIAMACVALSPVHVQFSQAIRMYGLMTLLAALSVYLFLRLIEENRFRWWGPHACVTLLLSWTHPFALLLPFVQGLFWLSCHPRDFFRLFRWGMLNGAAMAPAIAYIATIRFWGEDTTYAWMRLPDLSEFLADVFADDAIGMTYQLNATATAWAWLVGDATAHRIIAWRWAVGQAALVAAIAACGGLLVASWRRTRIPRTGTEGRHVLLQPRSEAWFLILWLVVPPLTLYVVSILWRPCIMPRYTLHSSLALYLIVAGAIAAIPMRGARVVVLVGVFLFYGYQQMLMLGNPQHPDYRGAVSFIRAEAKSDDILLGYNWLWKRVFAYNLGPAPYVISYGSTYELLGEQADFIIGMNLPSRHTDDAPRLPWIVVLTDYYDPGPAQELDRALRERGLSFRMYEFAGIQHVLVYRVWRGDGLNAVSARARPLGGEPPKEFGDLALEFWRAGEYGIAVRAAEKAIALDPNYSRAWAYLGMAHKELGNPEAALDAFEQSVQLNFHDYPWAHVNIAMILLDQGRHEQAVSAALRSLEVLPDDAWALTVLGKAYLALGELDAALDVLNQAVARDASDPRILDALRQAQAAAEQRGGNE